MSAWRNGHTPAKTAMLYHFSPSVEQATLVLRPGGWIFLEIGFDQGVPVVEWLARHGYNGVRVHKDLGNRDRVVLACR